MKKKYIEVRPWNPGDTVVANVTDFGLTRDKSYVVKREDPVWPDCFYIVDDTGEEVSYTQEWFR